MKTCSQVKRVLTDLVYRHILYRLSLQSIWEKSFRPQNCSHVTMRSHKGINCNHKTKQHIFNHVFLLPAEITQKDAVTLGVKLIFMPYFLTSCICDQSFSHRSVLK